MTDITITAPVETEEEKKTRNSPSRKIKQLEEKMDLFYIELKGLRDYMFRFEDYYVYKLGGEKPLPPPPETLLSKENIFHKKKRKEKITEEEPAAEFVEEIDTLLKKIEEPVKKKRGRPKKVK